MPKTEENGSPYQMFTVNGARVLVGECRNPKNPKNVGCLAIISNRPSDENPDGTVMIMSQDDIAALKMTLAFVHEGRVYETLGEVSGARMESLIAQFAALERKK